MLPTGEEIKKKHKFIAFCLNHGFDGLKDSRKLSDNTKPSVFRPIVKMLTIRFIPILSVLFQESNNSKLKSDNHKITLN